MVDRFTKEKTRYQAVGRLLFYHYWSGKAPNCTTNLRSRVYCAREK